MKLLLLSFLMLVLPSSKADTAIPAMHEFHLSKCLIEYNEAEQALQISMHLFVDDLEDALRLQGKDKLQIGTPKEDPKADEYVENYLADHFRLIVNGNEVKHNFLGKEPGEDPLSLWCYIEITGINKLGSLQIKNSLLIETFEDQKNLVSVIGPDKVKGYFILEKDKETSDILEFN